jgi:hypothetical protein
MACARDIDNVMLATAHKEWKGAPYGQQSYIAERWAATFNIAPQTLYRKLKAFAFDGPQRKEKATKGTAKIDHLHDYARSLAHMFAFLPRGCRKPPLDKVIEKALLNGILPAAAGEIHPSTFARVIRERNLLDEDGRVLRFEAKRPMEQVQYDVSGSEYLYVHRIDAGEPVLRVRPHKAYKNKDRFENMRLWYHGMVDDCSRYWLTQPFVSPGESSSDALCFCRWAFSRKADERVIFRGLPARIYMDNGPLSRAEMTQEFFERIGVEIKTHEPESPEDTGKIEIKWKQLWTNFEALEFLMDPNWESREYTLAEVRQRLMNYMVRLNKAAHPTRAGSREEVWLTVIRDGGVIDIDEAAFDSAFKRARRHVEPDGTFSLDNVTYSVKGLHDAWVYVYVGIAGGRMIAEDIQTHKRYDVAVYAVPGLDEIRADKAAPGKAIREEARAYKETYRDAPFRGIYEEEAEGAGETVVRFPVRARETRQVDDPFDTTVYASVEEARREFFEVTGTLIPSDEWKIIEGMIMENGLSKQFVLDLALEIRGEIEGRQHSI